MQQTFRGYLDARLRKKTGLKTSNLRRFVAYALDNHLEIAPELFLLALVREQVFYFMSLCWDTPLEDRYRSSMAILYKVDSVEEYLEHPETPLRFKQVYEDYLAASCDTHKDDVAMERLRTRTIRVLERTGTTRYAVCKALKLNAGNVYAYLNGDLSKVSLETAQKICDYVYSL